MQEDFAALHRISEAPIAGPSTSNKQAQPSQPAVASASSKLEPYIVLARSARGPAAAASVVDQATSANGVFCFGELLEVPSIAEVCCGTVLIVNMHDKALTWSTYPFHHSFKTANSTKVNGSCCRSSLMAS